MAQRLIPVCLLLVAYYGSPLAAAEVGKTLLARGAATAQTGTEAVRLLGKDAPVYEGDVISTGRRSFAVMQLADGTRMTLRPNTVFQLEEFNTQPQQESSVMRLFKGGLRAVTGFISKRNPRAFKVRTAVATIGIRGTTFDARLCDDDCAQESATARCTAKPLVTGVVGRVGFSRGNVSRTDTSGATFRLVVGSALYQGDTIRTASRSFAVLAFRDEGRVTVTPNSEFKIEEYRFKRDKPAESSSVMRLVRGGLRAVTGLIGRSRPNSYRVRTAVATIGIRGTGFDLLCQDECVSGGSSSLVPDSLTDPLLDLFRVIIQPALAATASAAGLAAEVWNGTIILFDLPGGDLVVNQGQVVFIPADGSAPVYLDQLPVELGGPRPDEVELDHEGLFETEAQDGTPPGLYVSCYQGDCDVDDVNLGAGEAAYTSADGTVHLRLELIPTFQSEDPWLDDRTLNLYNDLLHDISDGKFECRVAL